MFADMKRAVTSFGTLRTESAQRATSHSAQKLTKRSSQIRQTQTSCPCLGLAHSIEWDRGMMRRERTLDAAPGHKTQRTVIHGEILRLRTISSEGKDLSLLGGIWHWTQNGEIMVCLHIPAFWTE